MKKSEKKKAKKPVKKITKKPAKKTVKFKKPKTKRKLKRWSYCDGCVTKTEFHKLDRIGQDLLCGECQELHERRTRKNAKHLPWYAVAVAPSNERRARRNILRLVKEHELPKHVFNRVLIPRERVARITKDVYSCFNDEGKNLGEISADDRDTALWLAKKKWGDEHEVAQVVLERKGGKRLVQAKKSMSGYVMVQMDADNREAMHVVERASGVIGLLPLKPRLVKRHPYSGRVRNVVPVKGAIYEDLLDWKPQPLGEEEVARLLQDEADRKGKTMDRQIDYDVGSTVRIAGDSPYVGMEGKVVDLYHDGSEDAPVMAEVEIKLMGRPTVVKLDWWKATPATK